MAMFGSSWLPEGYYELDSYGDKTYLTTKEEIQDAFVRDKLYNHDGWSFNKIENINQIK